MFLPRGAVTASCVLIARPSLVLMQSAQVDSIVWWLFRRARGCRRKTWTRYIAAEARAELKATIALT
ncbi:hypothetical protein HII31_02538 [Pseudocercospora fuligena]|uniref:Uncharacterized protein n=1 Tax=Pseudocercospora fuligena TaxID=685502 RepID=A0A8H6VMW2_9PEZI|nr:hypothetical protein HII31_02538 [Pseudocercospora fuligena]